MNKFLTFGSAAALFSAAVCVPSVSVAKPAKTPVSTLADVCQQLVEAGYFINASDPLVACIEYVSSGTPTDLCAYAQTHGLLEYLGLTKGDCVSNLKKL